MELELIAEELRVLACLIEKSFTTPDQYPLTTNALTNACNQKTSRDPVVDYSAQFVDETILELRQGGWARSVRGTGNRSFKHKHVVDERLGLSDAEQAVFAVLALRGPQSVGELRTRTERYATFSSDGDEAYVAVERVLDQMSDRDVPLVRNVGRASGQSQDRWLQLVGTPGSEEVSAYGSTADGDSIPTDDHRKETPATSQAAPPPTSAQSADESDLDSLKLRLANLEQRVSDLEDLL